MEANRRLDTQQETQNAESNFVPQQPQISQPYPGIDPRGFYQMSPPPPYPLQPPTGEYVQYYVPSSGTGGPHSFDNQTVNIHSESDKKPIHVHNETTKLSGLKPTSISLAVDSACTILVPGQSLVMDFSMNVTGDFIIECIGCSLVMDVQYLDTDQTSTLNMENLMNSHLATNLIYHTSKVIPAVSNLGYGSDESPTRSVCRKRNEKQIWDHHDYYQGGRFPMTGPCKYDGKLIYHIPSEDVPATDNKNPDYFTRKWFIKVVLVIRKRKNLSVFFPIEIIN